MNPKLMNPEVSIVIVSYNTRDILRDCLRSIEHQTLLSHEIIVVDNGSTDGTQATIQAEFPLVHFVQNTENAGFARANNQGLAIARGEYLLFLNPDTLILNHAIDQMITFLRSQPSIGLLGPHVFNADGTTDQATAFWFPSVPRFALAHIPLAKQLARLVGIQTPVYGNYVPQQSGGVELVMGCCMAMPTALARDIGGLNEEYFMYSEELDLCESVHRRGLAVYYFREASIIHLGGASTAPQADAMAVEVLRSMMRYFQRREPRAIPTLRVLFIVGSTWRWSAWTMLRLLNRKMPEALIKQGNHAAMLRWLVWSFDF